MTALLDVAGLSVHFGGTRAVDGVDLQIEDGLLYGLIGPNGSGKSTLLGALSRLTALTAGTIGLDGVDCTRRSPEAVARLGIRRTFQTVRLLPSLSVAENVELGADARLAGRSIARRWLGVHRTASVERAVRAAADEALERLGLTGLARAMPATLPYGTQRRVEIARALAAQPRLLLLDEPTAGMTREERDEIGVLLRDLARDGLTQILVEHDVPLITRICDHLFVMNSGRLIASGDVPAAVVARPEVQEAYLGGGGAVLFSDPAAGRPLLEVRELAVRYGGIIAVRRVDVVVAAGQVCVVLGPNGAGKSSTVRAMCGLVRPSSGTVSFAGRDITRAPAHRIARAGMVLVPEGRRIFAPLSVEENLLVGGYATRRAATRAAALADVYEMFPVLHTRRNERAGLLSGGEQQMLAFGRALMADPRLMVMDEPSMGLSPAMVDQIMASVADIADRGIGVLMVEQNAAAALPVARDAVVLERGEVVLRGPAAEVATHPSVVKAFLGDGGVAPEGRS